MSAFSPSSHTFRFKKYAPSNLPPQSFIWGDIPGYELRNIVAIGLPNWLIIYNISYDIALGQVYFYLKIDEAVATSKLPGTYNYTLTLKGQYKSGGSWFPWITNTTSVAVTLIVENTLLLKLTPSTLTYKWTIGEALPQNQTVQIQSETNWNVTQITQSWITTDKLSGIGTSQLVVIVDPTGLAPGNYSGQIEIKDNFFTEKIDVFLTVEGEDTVDNYLYVTPSSFNFVSELQVENNKQIPLSLDASANWNTIISDSWIVVSETSGAGGINDLTISVNSIALAVGAYQGYIEFSNGDIIKTVYVNLRVIEFYTSGIESEGVYFVEDRNKLSVSSVLDNTYLQLDAVAATGLDNVPYKLEAPYLQGVATLLIGQETNNLMPLVAPPNNLTSHIKNNITPVNIGFTAFNVNRFTDAITQVAQFQNLLFLKGKTPTVANKLCNIPNNITVTNKAVLSLSVLSTSEAVDSVSITGPTLFGLSASIANNLYVYNAIINFADLGLVPGDNITIGFGSLEINATIKANEPEETLLAFENEWGEMELFPTTGFLTKTPSITDVQTKTAVEGKEQTKVVSIDYGIEYTLNTGFIYSQEEVDWLATMLKSKRKFIYEEGEPVEIILNTKKLKTYETREHTKSYNLQFKRALV